MIPSPCFALLLVCWTVCGSATGDNDQRDIALELLLGLNGDFDNGAQVRGESGQHDFIRAKFLPVETPVLAPQRQMYVEVAVNTRTVAMYVAVVKQDGPSKNIVTLTPYNFTDHTKYKFGEFKVEDLNNLTMNKFSGDPDCIITFATLGKGTFSGTWPDCKYIFGQHHPAFTLMFTCDAYSFTVPLSVGETPSAVPYILQRSSSKYPLINRPDRYVGPCEKMDKEL